MAARNLVHDSLYSYRDALKREEEPELRIQLPGKPQTPQRLYKAPSI